MPRLRQHPHLWRLQIAGRTLKRARDEVGNPRIGATGASFKTLYPALSAISLARSFV
jgi:hypothetical protein